MSDDTNDNPLEAWLGGPPTRARCVNCRVIVELGLEERFSRKWTHYGCGRIHSGNQYDESLLKKGKRRAPKTA
jgi:hypothetical protein